MSRRLSLLFSGVLGLLPSCAKTPVSLAGRPCEGGSCIDGYVCHPEAELCVPAVAVSCGGDGLCPSSVSQGDRCEAEGSFVSCRDDRDDCHYGCRTCEDGAWSACSEGTCTPDGVEVCDGVDNDCDTSIDEAGAGGCVEVWLDLDGDGFGDPGQGSCLCGGAGDGEVGNDDDCDDDPLACGEDCNPDADETCDGEDNDCNQLNDDGAPTGCTTYYRDNDNDNLGRSSESLCLCAPQGAFQATTPGDCDDGSSLCTTVCNDVDEDLVADCKDGCFDRDRDNYGTGTACDGEDLCDTQALAWISCISCGDADGDGFPAGCDDYTGTAMDCDDSEGTCGDGCHPGPDAPEEICDGYDNDCAGGTDVGMAPLLCEQQSGVCAGALHPEADCDGGVWNACQAATYTAHATAQGGGAYEATADETLCDGFDNNCDGVLDDGCAELAHTNTASMALCSLDADLSQDIVWNGVVNIDTDAGTINGSPTADAGLFDQPPTESRDVRVFQFDTLTLGATADVRVTGQYALVILACGDIVIQPGAKLSVNAQGAVRGPGGSSGGGPNAPGSGSVGGGAGTYAAPAGVITAPGGGGGGGCGVGGNGGLGVANGVGGDDSGETATLAPLRGGYGGGGGAAADTNEGRSGGGGGGAVQLVSNQRITIAGTITAAGGGGGGDPPAVSGGGGGGGGGSGGAILIEARHVVVTASAVIAANGGAGGGGSANPGDTTGETGKASDVRALGGTDGSGGTATGGRGAAGTTFAGETVGGVGTGYGGGGGGASGRIRLNTLRPSLVIPESAVVSPKPPANGGDPTCYSVGTGP